MAWFNDGLEILDKGGVVMYPLLALSILALAIIILKIYHFTRAQLRRLAFVDGVVGHLADHDIKQARRVLVSQVNPVARVMERAIEMSFEPNLGEKDRDAEIGRVGSGEVRRLESYLGGLEIIANLSPLLGLLGTVFGMIRAFVEVEKAGSKVDPAILAGGIWEALLTTAFGLSIAIPALGAFFLFEREVERLRSAMKDSVVRINAALGTERTGRKE
jgi:biopolymer transport protein ExbB